MAMTLSCIWSKTFKRTFVVYLASENLYNLVKIYSARQSILKPQAMIFLLIMPDKNTALKLTILPFI